MSAKIATLVPHTAKTPCTEVIDYLERILKEAKEGNIGSMAAILVTPAGDVITGWSYRPLTANGHHLIAGTAYLQQRLINLLTDEEPMEKPSA